MCLSARLQKFLIKTTVNSVTTAWRSPLLWDLRIPDRKFLSPLPILTNLLEGSLPFPPPLLNLLGFSRRARGSPGTNHDVLWRAWVYLLPSLSNMKRSKSTGGVGTGTQILSFLVLLKTSEPPQCSFLSLTKGGGCDNLCGRLAMLSRCRMRNSKWWTGSCLGVSL